MHEFLGQPKDISAVIPITSPFHKLFIPFAGTLVIFVVGAVLGLLFGRKPAAGNA